MNAELTLDEGYKKHDSVFTVAREITTPRVPSKPNDPSHDLAVIIFNDDGSFTHAAQLDDATAAIKDARCANPNGVIVVVFIHGWHHDAAWDRVTNGGDAHFSAFRWILMTLALREAERYGPNNKAQGRRVIGVYLGWNGDPAKSWRRCIPILTNTTFWERYRTAEKIAEGIDVQKTVEKIVIYTKGIIGDNHDLADSPLILIGHSMGALILESACLALLKNDPGRLVVPYAGDRGRPVFITRQDHRVTCPDLLLLLNSAADSGIAKEITTKLQELKVRKLAASTYCMPLAHTIRFSAPVLVSITSPRDLATRIAWPVAHWLRRKTEGHDRSLFTHELRIERSEVKCKAKAGEHLAMSFNQPWHCLRYPEPRNADFPSFRIDLPKKVPLQEQDTDKPHHVRYILRPLQPNRRRYVFGRKHDSEKSRLCWVFRTPPEIIGDHNDIFNFRSSLLILALMQICGAVMSLATVWDEVFEEETP